MEESSQYIAEAPQRAEDRVAWAHTQVNAYATLIRAGRRVKLVFWFDDETAEARIEWLLLKAK